MRAICAPTCGAVTVRVPVGVRAALQRFVSRNGSSDGDVRLALMFWGDLRKSEALGALWELPAKKNRLKNLGFRRSSRASMRVSRHSQ